MVFKKEDDDEEDNEDSEWVDVKEDNNIVSIMQDEINSLERDYYKNFGLMLWAKSVSEYTNTSMFDVMEYKTVGEVLGIMTMITYENNIRKSKQSLTFKSK